MGRIGLISLVILGLGSAGIAACAGACAGARKGPPAVRADRAPNVSDAQRTAEHWTERWGAGADRPLMDAEAVEALNARNSGVEGSFRDVVEPALMSEEAVLRQLDERFVWLKDKLASGDYVEAESGSLERSEVRARAAGEVDELRVLVAEADLRCVPMSEGLFVPPADPAFDRNQCSRIHVGELVRVRRLSTDGVWAYVHTGHAVGWVRRASWTPPLDPDQARAFRDEGERLVILADGVAVAEGGPILRLGASVPLLGRTEAGGYRVRVPRAAGLEEAVLPPGSLVHVGFLPLTRRHLFELAFEHLGSAYGWGGLGGGRDCSRLTLDLLSVFGLRLGRHSGVQARSGARTVELGELPDDAARRAALQEAARDGIVFVWMPGHIMIYLGEEGGRDFAISAIAEYLRPTGDGDQTVRLDRVVVSDLEVGRGTARTAFVERMQRLAVFGAAAEEGGP